MAMAPASFQEKGLSDWWAGPERLLTVQELGCPLLCPFQIPAAQVSLVLFGGKVSGAAADPLAGFLINRSRRTGSGRLMPW